MTNQPDPGVREVVTAAGIPFSALTWGDPSARPLVLLHGVTASAAIWWRVGPALAATGRRVVAPDLPGHGRQLLHLGAAAGARGQVPLGRGQLVGGPRVLAEGQQADQLGVEVLLVMR